MSISKSCKPAWANLYFLTTDVRGLNDMQARTMKCATSQEKVSTAGCSGIWHWCLDFIDDGKINLVFDCM